MKTTEELKKWRDRFIKNAPVVFSLAGEIQPIVFMLLADGKTMILKTEFHNPAAKEVFSRFLRDFCNRNSVIALLMVTEGYSKTLDPGEADKYKGVPVKDIEGSKEVIHFTFETKLISEMGYMEVNRDGERATLSEYKDGGGAVKGRFTHFLTNPTLN